MTTYNYETVQDFIDFCDSTVGYLEKKNKSKLGDLFTKNGKETNAGSANYTIIASYYKEITGEDYQGQAWCAMFVSVMFAMVFGIAKGKNLMGGSYASYCPYIGKNFAKKYDTPEVGDIVLFWSASKKRYSHTGIVAQVNSDGSFTTIEGNTTSGNDIVIDNGGCIARKTYSTPPTKCAFCRPDWQANNITFGGELNKSLLQIKGTLTILQDVSMYDDNGTFIQELERGCACVASYKKFVDGKPLYQVTYKNRTGWVSPSHMIGWVLEIDDSNRWWYLKDCYTWYSDCIAVIGDKPFVFGSDGYCITGRNITITADKDGYLSLYKE